jgi:hypothetical protein
MESHGLDILDALDSHVAVLDASGLIVYVNEAWRAFAVENGNPDMHGCGVGSNYFEACVGDAGVDSDYARAAVDGMRRVAAGDLPRFEMDYPCDSPTEKRWFTLRCTPLKNWPGGGLVTTHTNITAQRTRSIADEVDRNQAERRQENSREIDRVEQLARPALRGGAAARAVHDRMVQAFHAALDAAVERRLFSPEPPKHSRSYGEFTEELGQLRAGPRDVVDLYVDLMRRVRERVPAPKHQVYVEEGRLLLLEVMGNLMAFYRQRAGPRT